MFERRQSNTIPIKWTSDEEEKLLSYLERDSFDIHELASIFPNRTRASLRSKVRKLKIKNDLFGASYREVKQKFTEKCAQQIKPNLVFEAYAGAGHQTKIWAQYANYVYASDKLRNKLKQFSEELSDIDFIMDEELDPWIQFSNSLGKKVFFFPGDALQAAIELSFLKINIDVLDLDTCGSTLPLLPTFLALLRPKFLLITHGEFHSFRFGRDDVLRRVLFSRDIRSSSLDLSNEDIKDELDKTVKLSALRSHNETKDSLWANLIDETWLGPKNKGLLRRFYKIERPIATADCLNELLE